MALSRYSVVDAYTTEELRREYEASSPRGRISLLKKFRKASLQFEIAALAAQDPNVQVRQWFAREFNFNYLLHEREPRKEGEQPQERFQRMFSGRRALEEALKTDPDPFVRACLRENSTAFPGVRHLWQDYFMDAGPLERLGLMRNNKIPEDFVRQIFDPEDVKLGITMQDREQLARAFLSNGAKLAKAGQMDFEARTLSEDLWKLAIKWPEKSDIPATIFDEVPISPFSSFKADAYRACIEHRLIILFNCDWQDNQIVQMALQDPDENCRLRAFEIVGGISGWFLEALIKRKDKVALRGLAQNELVSDEYLGKIETCLRDIDPEGSPHTARTIERKRKATITHDPDRLFGKEGHALLEEKIDFIGRAFVRMEARELALHRKLFWTQAAGVLSILLLLYIIFR
jgi:hypothetical protein